METNLALFLAENVKFILLHLIKTTFFTHCLCLLFSEGLYVLKVSVGDNVPVVLAAVALNLLPVAIVSRCITELHCAYSVTSWAG